MKGGAKSKRGTFDAWVAAGLVADPSDLHWCDHAALLGRRTPHLCDAEAAHWGFGDTLPTSRFAYLSRIRSVAEERWLRAGVRDLPWWANVANDELLTDPEETSGCEDFTGAPVEPEPPTVPSLPQLAADVCRDSSIAVSALKGRSRSKKLAAARKWFASCAVDLFGYAVKEVAGFLGKHPGAVSRWIETPTDHTPERL